MSFLRCSRLLPLNQSVAHVMLRRAARLAPGLPPPEEKEVKSAIGAARAKVPTVGEASSRRVIRAGYSSGTMHGPVASAHVFHTVVLGRRLAHPRKPGRRHFMDAHTSDDKKVGTVATMTAAAQELGATTATRANEAASVVGEKIGSLATVIPGKAPHEGAVATAASAVADGLESASSYLREKKFDALAHEVTNLVRTYPVQSLLIGVGLGYLLV